MTVHSRSTRFMETLTSARYQRDACLSRNHKTSRTSVPASSSLYGCSQYVHGPAVQWSRCQLVHSDAVADGCRERNNGMLV